MKLPVHILGDNVTMATQVNRNTCTCKYYHVSVPVDQNPSHGLGTCVAGMFTSGDKCVNVSIMR